MSTKSQNVKNFINQTGVNKQLFVFVGSDTTNATSNSTQTAIDIWNHSDFALRIGQNSVVAVVPYVKWIAKRSYTPWSSNSTNIGNFYAYNDQNGYVYLCISDNANNTVTTPKNISNIRPTHTAGIQSYSDGYSWLTLYKITPSHERFVTSKWIPVISFDTFDSSDQQTQLAKTQTFCDYSTGDIGSCGIYAKLALSTDDDDGTIEYQIGDLFTVAENITCSDCHYLMYNNDKFTSVFYPDGDTIPDAITIHSPYEEVGTLILANELSSASPYYHLYNINENHNIDDGCILSAFVDLSSFTNDQLIVTQENPEFTIDSNTGSDGRIRLLTTIYQDNYIISGIEVIARGSGYKEIILSMDESVFAGVSADTLINKISINLDKIDHIGIDPISVLGAQHVMIDARIEKQTLIDNGIGIPQIVNFFGLIENPIGISGSAEVISGTDINKKLDILYRTTIKAKFSAPLSSALLPEADEVYDTSTTTGITITDLSIGGVSDIVSGAISTAIGEIKNIPYVYAANLNGSSLVGPKGGTTKPGAKIKTVEEVPSFIQYTGNILSTTKLSADLPVADVDSIIIRINMVRGM